jgi:flagellar protein FlaG
MDVARTMPETSSDVGRAGVVEASAAVARLQAATAAATAAAKVQRPSGEPRSDDTNSSMPTLETLRENFRESVERANERLSDRGASINISIDRTTNNVIVQVTDRETGDTIRQIPAESALRVSQNIDRLTGILVDQKI